jgi:hypothetical protein
LWHRSEGSFAIRCPYKLKTGKGQSGLDYPDRVDLFKQVMLAGGWNFEEKEQPLVYWRESV